MEPTSRLSTSFQGSRRRVDNRALLHTSSARQGDLSIYKVILNRSDFPLPISLPLSSLTMIKQTHLGG